MNADENGVLRPLGRGLTHRQGKIQAGGSSSILLRHARSWPIFSAVSVGLRDVVREPLVHFILIGAALFGLDRAVQGGERAVADELRSAPAQDGAIVVDDGVREALVQSWTRTHSAPPTSAELGELIERWVDEEVLYREGVRRGFADNDPEIHDRVADQMRYALQQGATVPDPSEAQLRAWFEAHAEALQQPGRIDFTQVFVEGDDASAEVRARALLVLLEDGAQPAGLGDTFAGGRRFRGRKLADVTERFGASFASGLDTEPLQTWTLRRSSFGLHLVRVDRVQAGSTPGFDAVREEVVHGWRQDQQAQRLAEATLGLRKRWTVVRTP